MDSESIMTGIRNLRQGVLALVDGDLLVPEDGRRLSDRLEAALEWTAAGEARAVEAALLAFIDHVEALIRGGILAAGDGHEPIGTARAILASLPR